MASSVEMVERFGWTFAAGDKMMQIENDYDKEVYNRDIGYVEGIDLDAPNSPLRPAITALAPESVAVVLNPAAATAAEDPPKKISRSPARYLWVMLLARIYEAFPLICPRCGAEMRIIAFIAPQRWTFGPSWSTSANPTPRHVAPRRGDRRYPLFTTQSIAHRKTRLATPWRADSGRIGCRRCSDGASRASVVT